MTDMPSCSVDTDRIDRGRVLPSEPVVEGAAFFEPERMVTGSNEPRQLLSEIASR